MQPGGDYGGRNLTRGGGRSRGGSFIRSRDNGGGGMGSGEQSALIDEGGGHTLGRNPSFAYSRGGGGSYNGGDLGGETKTARRAAGSSTSQSYDFRGGAYSRGGESTQYQQPPPGTSIIIQPSFAQSSGSRGYGGRSGGSQRQGFSRAHAQESGYNEAPVGMIRKTSIDQAANDQWAKQKAIQSNKDIVPQETTIKPPEKHVDMTEQQQTSKQPSTFQQAPAPIGEPATEVSPTLRETLGKSSFGLSVLKQVSAVQKPAPVEVPRSTIQKAPAPVISASNPGGNIATTTRNVPAEQHNNIEMAEKNALHAQWHNSIDKLRETGANSDCTLLVGGEELKAHRSILTAISPTFEKMFSKEANQETSDGIVRIEDPPGMLKDSTAKPYKALLCYAYTGCVDWSIYGECKGDVLVVAYKYFVLALKHHVERQLAVEITTESLAELALLADTYSCDQLKKASVKFLSSNCLAVVTTPQWDALMKTRLDLASELLRLVREYKATAPTAADG